MKTAAVTLNSLGRVAVEQVVEVVGDYQYQVVVEVVDCQYQD